MSEIGVRRIAVSPFGDRSWALTFGPPLAYAPMLFRSGARAEAAGLQLLRRLAGEGVPSELTIGLRDGSVAARFVSAAPQAG